LAKMYSMRDPPISCSISSPSPIRYVCVRATLYHIYSDLTLVDAGFPHSTICFYHCEQPRRFHSSRAARTPLCQKNQRLCRCRPANGLDTGCTSRT